jgi:hypothetical protein
MKLTVLCGLVVVAVLASTPASAQVVIYDNFEAKVLNPENWFGNDGSSNAGVFILESGRQIKTEPLFGFKGVNIFNRSYASQGSDTGNASSNTRLFFNGSNISTIQATVLVKKIQATGCSAVNTFATSPRVRIGGAFFNAGAVAPTPGDQTNDVFAFVTVGRELDSTNPAKVLDIQGTVFRCGDAGCSGANSTQIGEELLGTVKVNQKVKVRVTWDPGADRFVFQKGKGPEVAIAYTGNNDVFGPGTVNGGNKRLEVNHQLPNCTSAPRPVAYMEAYFDDIKVNASAVP